MGRKVVGVSGNEASRPAIAWAAQHGTPHVAARMSVAAAGGRRGLNRREVLDRQARGLGNFLPNDTGRSFAQIILTNTLTVFNGVVVGGFTLLLALGAWQDALFGFFVIANTAIGVVQEYRANRILARLAVLNTPRALVRRDGVDVDCAVADVVLDDLLVLRPGAQVTADALVLESRELELDEALLTGEADPIMKQVGDELLSGSIVLGGSGLAQVSRVGMDSYAARITAEARRFTLVDSEIRREIGRIIRWLSLGVLPIGAIVVNGQMQAVGGWTAAISSGMWRDAAVASASSIIAMIPAGLVFMTSVALALGAVRLARRGVLVRELAAVEGLARTDVLCIDKTGTLTQGTMELDRVEPVSHAARGWERALSWLVSDPAANATAQAIGKKFGEARAVGAGPERVVAFSSRHKWSAAFFTDDISPGTWVLGGADVVLADSSMGTTVRARADELSDRGERTLVLARSGEPIAATGDTRNPSLPAKLVPVALLVLHEVLRSDAGETIRFFNQQGVDVVVMSGDEPRTVAAVARQIGLPIVRAIDARELPTEAEELAQLLRVERIFGRVTPEQKKSMVIAMRSSGRKVAMIGDGVNDTLALKNADLGIAMSSGSAAARAVAHLVLLEGDFSRLPRVVAEGRQVIANVELLAKLFLSKTVYAVVLALVFGLLLWPFPFLPRQLSVVDGLTIGLPALVLALRPNARIYQAGFLRRVARFCIPSGLIVAASVLAVVAWAFNSGALPPQTHTLSFITLTLSALWVLTVLARPFTRVTTAVILSAYVGLGGVLVTPVAREFLQLAPPSSELLLVAVSLSVLASLAIEAVHRSMSSIATGPMTLT